MKGVAASGAPKLVFKFPPFEFLSPILGMASVGALMIPAGKMVPANRLIRGILLGGVAALLLDRPPLWFSGGSGNALDALATLGLFLLSGIAAAAASGRVLVWMPDRLSVRSAPLYVVAFVLVGLGALVMLWLQALTFGTFD